MARSTPRGYAGCPRTARSTRCSPQTPSPKHTGGCTPRTRPPGLWKRPFPPQWRASKGARVLPKEPRHGLPRAAQEPPHGVTRLPPQRGFLVAFLGHQWALPDPLPVDQDLDLAELLTGVGRGGELLLDGYPPLHVGVRAYEAGYVSGGGERHGLLRAVGKRGLIVDLVPAHQGLAVVVAKPVLQNRLSDPEALVRVFRTEGNGYKRLVVRLGGGNEVGACLRRGSGLYAARRRVATEELGGGGDLYLPVLGVDRGFCGAHRFGEQRVLERLACQHGEIPAAGVVLVGVQAGGGLEVGVLQAQRGGPIVHHLHEVPYAPAAHVLGQGVSRVRARRDQGGH